MSTLNENSRAPDQDASPENNNQHSSQSQNNSGNIGREVDEERSNLNTSIEPKPNETGFAENEENHSSRNYAQHTVTSDEPDSVEIASEKHPKRGPNHLNNPGGTSQEDVENNTLPNEEYLKDDDDYGI
ncbi:MAG: hypothetical protein JWQ25_837 [Daejeonella sp.]|nr:hypothetical protein [Daejeonella sp.]